MDCHMVSSESLANFPLLDPSFISLRPPTIGPEYELLLKYVRYNIPSPPPGQSIAIFIEPDVEVGFPDAVIVFWELNTARNWPLSRRSLTKTDIKILNYIILKESVTERELVGVFRRSVRRSLERLSQADTVLPMNKGWQAQPVGSIYAVRRLIAIEAKLSAWKSGLRQAFRNTWFASESYLLVPETKVTCELLVQAEQLGIGLLDTGLRIGPTAGSVNNALPTSYASWLFNEWTWRSIAHAKVTPSDDDEH